MEAMGRPGEPVTSVATTTRPRSSCCRDNNCEKNKPWGTGHPRAFYFGERGAIYKSKLLYIVRVKPKGLNTPLLAARSIHFSKIKTASCEAVLFY